MMNDAVEQVDQVIHLTAAVGVKRIIDEPAEDTTNVAGRGNYPRLLPPAREAAPDGVQVREIYGKAGVALHKEHDRIMEGSTHRGWASACGKALDEFLVQAYHGGKGLPVVIGRLLNTVGRRQSCAVGAWPEGSATADP